MASAFKVLSSYFFFFFSNKILKNDSLPFNEDIRMYSEYSSNSFV